MMNDFRYTHVLNYGASGVGKSYLAATAPTPFLLALWDSLGNATPYLTPYALRETKDVVVIGGKASIIHTIDCYDKADHSKLCGRIWDFDPSSAGTKLQWDIKRATLQKECSDIGARTFIFDSLTLFHTSARRVARSYGAGNEEEMAYAITDYIEDLCISLCALPLNVILCAHISDRIYNIRDKVRKDTSVTAPGRMGRNIFSMFSDVWYCFVDESGQHKVLTKTDDTHTAKNTVLADLTCDNNYAAITANAKPLEWITD